jgi:DNA-binding transcriptional ArsR family regulator
VEDKTVLRLTDPETARLIVDGGAQRFLRPFLSRECTAKVAADRLGVSLSLMSYWLKRFQDARLLEVVRLEPRSGRPVKIYRTTADVFIAPFELLPSATLMEFFGTFSEEQQRRFTKALGRVAETWLVSDWGFRIQLNEDGKVRTDATPDPAKTDVVPDFLAQDAPAAWQSFSTIRLRFDEAKALQRELAELWERYSSKDDGDVYHLHLGLVKDDIV